MITFKRSLLKGFLAAVIIGQPLLASSTMLAASPEETSEDTPYEPTPYDTATTFLGVDSWNLTRGRALPNDPDYWSLLGGNHQGLGANLWNFIHAMGGSLNNKKTTFATLATLSVFQSLTNKLIAARVGPDVGVFTALSLADSFHQIWAERVGLKKEYADWRALVQAGFAHTPIPALIDSAATAMLVHIDVLIDGSRIDFATMGPAHTRTRVRVIEAGVVRLIQAGSLGYKSFNNENFIAIVQAVYQSIDQESLFPSFGSDSKLLVTYPYQVPSGLNPRDVPASEQLVKGLFQQIFATFARKTHSPTTPNSSVVPE